MVLRDTKAGTGLSKRKLLIVCVIVHWTMCCCACVVDRDMKPKMSHSRIRQWCGGDVHRILTRMAEYYVTSGVHKSIARAALIV